MWLTMGMGMGIALAGTWSIEETVHIDAPPEVVWNVLVDFDAYADWNPWLVHAEGRAEVGTEVPATVLLPEPRRARHGITAVTPHRQLCWEDRGWFVALARGARCRTLTPTADGTTFHVVLSVKGSAAGMVARTFGDAMADGLAAETAALKTRAEALAMP